MELQKRFCTLSPLKEMFCISEKTIRSLSQRLNGYVNPGPTQSTNIKNCRKIEKILQQGREINIFVFAPHENEIVYRGIPVNLAAGLEDSLIGIIKPPWNDTGKIT